MTSRRRSIRAYLSFFFLFLAALLICHWPVLGLPYFWDELGQFVPAALDIFNSGAWIPKSTLPNVHPPGVMAYLALVWKLLGYSITTTRVSMLLLAAAGVLATFLLAIELCRGMKGAPALLAPILLLSSPLFWSQSMMAQLDMPAMAFTCLSLWFFVRGRLGACALASTVLVLCKETSIVTPFVLGCILLYERRFRESSLFLIPAAALGVWLLLLRHATGTVFGNQEFAHYNIGFQLHPVRLVMTLLRRLFYLLVENGHFVGAAVIFGALRRTRIFGTRNWEVVATVAAVQILVVCAFGGAALERYLLPVIPLFYIAVAAALSPFTRFVRTGAAVLMIVGLIAGILINSPFPYPFENNAAFVSFVRLQQLAAGYVESQLPGKTVVSAWPFPDALRRPEFGYVRHPVPVRGLANFDPETVLQHAGKIEVLVVYSRTWEPSWGVLRLAQVKAFLEKYYMYRPQITSAQIQRELGLTPVARWEERGQWIEIFVANPAPHILIL